MFTGLVQAVGRIVQLSGHSLQIEWPETFSYEPPRIGESIAVNGCCLTLTDGGNIASFDLSEETLSRTTFQHLNTGQFVNLERALRAGESIGGHFVQGHIDGVGKVISIEESHGFFRLAFEVPASGSDLLVDKGSIAIDGISLTVIDPDGCEFESAIVPHTWSATNLSSARPGTPVNVEFDILAKHVKRLLALK